MEYVEVAVSNTLFARRSDGELLTWPSAPIPLPALPWGVYYVEVDAGGDYFLGRHSDGLVEWGSELTPYALYQGRQLPTPPELLPGESFAQLSVSDTSALGARIGPTSTYVSFGHGCAGSRPTSRLVPMDTPRIGKPHVVHVLDLPHDLAILAFGWTRTQPTPLDAYGMPGCELHISLDTAFLLTGQNGWAKARLSIPDDPTLVGLHFHHQALIPDAGANALGAVVSDAAEGVIGNW